MAYTTIDNPELYFQTKLYTGNSTQTAITLDGSENMQPDWVWIKTRSASNGHTLIDSVRGVTKRLASHNNQGDVTDSTMFVSFDSDGFTLGSDSNDYTNYNNQTHAAWCWKAGGSASSNSNGSITSTVSANTTSGFSIVSWTGSGSSATIGHGLGSTPKFIIVKNRTDSVNWMVYHHSVITASATNKSFMTLNTTDALGTNGSATTFTSVSDTTFGVGTDNIINGSSDNMIAYVFADTGNKFFKAGSYTGNGSTDGPMIVTGMKPAWVMIKRTDGTNSWVIYDNKREGYNVDNDALQTNGTNAEGTSDDIDLLSNGFKMRTSGVGENGSGNSYIYMCFASSPFTTSTGIPTTAR